MNWIKLFIILALAATIYSCSPTKQLAEEFVATSSKNTSLYLVPAGYLEKANLKKSATDNLEGLTAAQRDSTRLARTLFLKAVSDSVFLTRFVNAYMDELRALGVRVCLDGPDSLQCPPKENSFVVKMQELELREFILKVTDEQFIYNAIYQKDIDLQAVSLHAWFAIDRLNRPAGKHLFYAENYISDELIDSGFGRKESDGSIVHYRRSEPLTLDKIYNMAEALGHKYASYTYDYILNEYVFRNLKNHKPGRYFHYNRFKGRLESAGDNRFSIQ